MRNRRFLLLVVVFVLIVMPMTAWAGNPYKDVTLKRVDKSSYDAIAYVKQHYGWAGIAKKGRLYPNRYITRREFIIVLTNMWGKEVVDQLCKDAGVSYSSDLRAANTGISSGFVCNRMVILSRVLGFPIKWTGTGTRMRRKDAARYIKIFATFNPALAPRR